MPGQDKQSTDTPTRDGFLRRKTVAQDCDVSTRTISRWEAQGLFPARVRLGPNSTGYRESEYRAWKAQRPRDRE